MAARSTKWREILKTLFVLVLLFVGYMGIEVVGMYRAKPPATVQTLDDYLNWQTKHRRIELLEKGGQTFVLMQGPNAGLVPSGPPIYVFDQSGKLVDWTTDCGDDPRFQTKWLDKQQAREVSLEEARKLVSATRPAS